MSGAPRFGLGVLLILVAGVPVVTGSRAVRRRLLPQWAGAPARLCEVVLELAAVVAVSELLGTVRLFRLVPMVVGLFAVGMSGVWFGRHAAHTDWAHSEDAIDAAPGMHPWRLARLGVVAAAIALLAGEWSVNVAFAERRGMQQVDTLWYHMPTAARFVQEGSTWHVHFIDHSALVTWYPATSELFTRSE